LDLERAVSSPEYPKGGISPISRTSCPYEAGEESLQRRSLMGDDDGLFVSGPAVV
jgi:ribosome modulation factor